MTCTDAQIRKLRRLNETYTQETAAAKAGIDLKTARKYLKKRRAPSRPARLLAIEAQLRSLAAEYLHWRDALPENLAESELAQQLDDVVDQLDNLADEVNALDPPRGFGR